MRKPNKLIITGIFMNKRNMLAMLSLFLALAAVSYTALSPFALAIRQDTTIRGTDATAGQGGLSATGLKLNDHREGNGDSKNANGASNQGNNNTQELNANEMDGTNGQNGNGAAGANGLTGQNGNGAAGANGLNGAQGSNVSGSNGFDGDPGDFNIEVR
jgi:hypothetical protein